MKRNSVRNIFCTAALALMSAAVPFRGASAQSSDDATRVLRDAINSEAQVSYIGEVQNVQIGESQSNVTVYRVEHLAPNLTRYWYLAPQALYGDSIIVRGQTSSSVDIKRGTVIVQNNNVPQNEVEVTLDTNFALLLANYRPTLAPNDIIFGKPVRVILLVNKHTGATMMRLYIDAATHLVLEKDRYAPNGSLISQIRFQQIRYTKNIPKGIFSTPKGLKVTQGTGHGAVSSDFRGSAKDAGFNAQVPRYLPEGFVPTTSDVSKVQGIPTLHLLYSDGIRTLSLFENASGAAVDMSRYRAQTTTFTDRLTHKEKTVTRTAHYIDVGPMTLFAWEESGLHLALVGELSLPELTKIAASIVP